MHGSRRERLGSLGLGALSLVAVVAGVLMLVRGERGIQAWLVLLFFGSCFLIFVAHGLDARYARGIGGRTVVDVVNILAMGGFCIAVLLFGLFWPGLPWVLRGFLVVCGAIGVTGTAALALRPMLGGGTRVVLAREGVVMETRRATLLVPWTHIAAAASGNVHRNVSLLLWLELESGPPRVLASRAEAEAVLAKWARDRTYCAAFAGCDWYVMQHMLDEPVGVLAERITAALADPAERAALPPYTS